jgi:GTP:adenosylcobinamide-phosphate guanylyltransferase
MDAIVIAGGVPQEGEPLYDYTQGKPKALLEIAGKPMVQWVFDALCKADEVDQIVVVGLDEDNDLSCSKAIAYIPSQGGIVENVRAGVNKIVQENPTENHVLAVSSDIPAITPEIVDWCVQTALETDEDVYYNLISRQVMEERFPNANRSYARFKDIDVCGGDMNVLRTQLVMQNDELWKKIVAARKNVFKQAALIGYDTLFLLLFRLITLDDAVRRVTKRLNIKAKAVLCPYAEVGMDVDKPHQLELIRADLAKGAPDK